MGLSKSSYLSLAIDLSKVELSLAMNFLKDELSSAKRIYQRQSHQSPYSGLWIISLSLFRLKHFVPDYILSTPEKIFEQFPRGNPPEKAQNKVMSWCLGAALSFDWHSFSSSGITRQFSLGNRLKKHNLIMSWCLRADLSLDWYRYSSPGKKLMSWCLGADLSIDWYRYSSPDL